MWNAYSHNGRQVAENQPYGLHLMCDNLSWILDIAGYSTAYRMCMAEGQKKQPGIVEDTWLVNIRVYTIKEWHEVLFRFAEKTLKSRK